MIQLCGYRETKYGESYPIPTASASASGAGLSFWSRSFIDGITCPTLTKLDSVSKQSYGLNDLDGESNFSCWMRLRFLGQVKCFEECTFLWLHVMKLLVSLGITQHFNKWWISWNIYTWQACCNVKCSWSDKLFLVQMS